MADWTELGQLARVMAAQGLSLARWQGELEDLADSGAPLSIAAVPPRRTVDATGCGDTYLAAYLARRITTDDLRECGAFAAAAAAINIERVGAFGGSAAEIAERRAAAGHGS